MSNALDQIMAYKVAEIAALKSANRERLQTEAYNAMRHAPPRGFLAALQAQKNAPPIIAEIKRASPSRGLICADFDPAQIARAYHAGGATCISVLTDAPSFQGAPAHLRSVREAVSLPILRKDFMLEPIQIIESRAMGADAVLIIMGALSDAQAVRLLAEANTWQLDALIETHNEAEMARAIALTASLATPLIGINNRDLTRFTTDLTTTHRLAKLAPKAAFLISESGISSPAETETLLAAGAKGFLIGETLMRAAPDKDAIIATTSQFTRI